MLKLGQYQKLTIVKKVEFGVYLAEEQDMEKRVLLPAKQVPENAKTGDELEVFLYKDSKDKSAKDHSWRACCFACGTGWKNRCIP